MVPVDWAFVEVLYPAWLHLMKSRHLFTSILKNVEVALRVLRKALHVKLIELICFLSQTMNWVKSPSRLQALSLRTRSLRSFFTFGRAISPHAVHHPSPCILVQFFNVQFYCLHIQLWSYVNQAEKMQQTLTVLFRPVFNLTVNKTFSVKESGNSCLIITNFISYSKPWFSEWNQFMLHIPFWIFYASTMLRIIISLLLQPAANLS